MFKEFVIIPIIFILLTFGGHFIRKVVHTIAERLLFVSIDSAHGPDNVLTVHFVLHCAVDEFQKALHVRIGVSKYLFQGQFVLCHKNVYFREVIYKFKKLSSIKTDLPAKSIGLIEFFITLIDFHPGCVFL